jgi:3-carboxy-cis,cis-muconate cycloisomerase
MSFSALDSQITGPLFRTERMAGVFSDYARIKAMLRCEEALARAQAMAGLVPVTLATAIASITLDDFNLSELGQATALAGVPTIPFVKAVQANLPRDLEPFSHFGATTQDIADTALALQMREGFTLIARDLATIISELVSLAEQHKSTPCIGRTYMQHAAPITFGFKISTRIANILAFAQRLKPLCDQSLLASLGGPVGTLTTMGTHGPAILKAYADALKLGCPPIAMHAQRGPMAGIAAWLAGLCEALGAWGSDIVHLSSTEVAEVSEPYVAGRGGSSAMPHKRNPVSATVLVAAATAAPGLASTMFTAMIAPHERPAGAWHAEWHALPQLFGLTSGALQEAHHLAKGLNVDVARMRANIDHTHGLIFADAASAALAPTRGRAGAYAIVEAAANHARSQGGELETILLASNLTPSERNAVEQAFRLEPAIAAAAQWVDPVCEKARAVHAALLNFVEEA